MDVFHQWADGCIGHGEGGCSRCASNNSHAAHDLGMEADVSHAVAAFDSAEQEHADRMKGGWDEI